MISLQEIQKIIGAAFISSCAEIMTDLEKQGEDFDPNTNAQDDEKATEMLTSTISNMLIEVMPVIRQYGQEQVPDFSDLLDYAREHKELLENLREAEKDLDGDLDAIYNMEKQIESIDETLKKYEP